MAKAFVFCLAALLAFLAPAVAGEKVGNVGAANVAAFGSPPGAAKHALTVGIGVENGEKIETSKDGSAQIVFHDSSTMTVGRSSSVVIDNFAYGRPGGSQALRLAKGVLRFIGGGVSHHSGAAIVAPMAQIGIRGGSALVRAGGECGTLVVHQVGIVEVRGANGTTQVLNRPGFGVCASAQDVSEPFRVSGATIAALTAAMASRNGQQGGVSRPPTNEGASVALGNGAPADVQPPPGLDALAPLWAGAAIVQSQANSSNQPTPPSPAPQSARETPPTPDVTPQTPSVPEGWTPTTPLPQTPGS
jgi:hypothetical protein